MPAAWLPTPVAAWRPRAAPRLAVLAISGPSPAPTSPSEHHRHAGRRRYGDGTQDRPHAIAGCRPEARPGQHLVEHDLHLVARESCPQASPLAAPEGEEAVRARPRADEAVGVEALGLRPEVGAVVRRVDGSRHVDPRG